MIDLEETACPRCNISGIHACPGKPVPPMTPEDKERFRETLKKVFKTEQEASKDND